MDNFERTRLAMKELVKGSSTISQEEFDKILEEHEIFLMHGGAGGSWDTFYLKNLIFGTYRITHITQGQQAKLGFTNLSRVRLTELSLPYADCAGVLCEEKDWSYSDLEGSLFIDSILNHCSFERADLSRADFSRSEMRNCNFRGSNLLFTDFEDCDLTGADFRGAQIDPSTLFKNATLAQIKKDQNISLN